MFRDENLVLPEEIKDIFYLKLVKNLKKSRDKYEKSETASKKSEVFLESIFDTLIEYINEVGKLSQEQFDELYLKRKKEVEELETKTRQKILKQQMDDNKISMEDIGAMSLFPDMANSLFEGKSTKLDKELSPDVFGRLFMLEMTSKFELFSYVSHISTSLTSLTKLESLLKRRFNNDFNWATAVSILALQENLVKKKLLDLEYGEDEIKDLLNNKGKHFPNLIELLSEEIKNKENREVGLDFFKSSGLREIRNRLEHEGFKYSVTSSDVEDLLKDLEKFESELFQDDN